MKGLEIDRLYDPGKVAPRDRQMIRAICWAYKQHEGREGPNNRMLSGVDPSYIAANFILRDGLWSMDVGTFDVPGKPRFDCYYRIGALFEMGEEQTIYDIIDKETEFLGQQTQTIIDKQTGFKKQLVSTVKLLINGAPIPRATLEARNDAGEVVGTVVHEYCCGILPTIKQRGRVGDDSKTSLLGLAHYGDSEVPPRTNEKDSPIRCAYRPFKKFTQSLRALASTDSNGLPELLNGVENSMHGVDFLLRNNQGYMNSTLPNKGTNLGALATNPEIAGEC